MKDAASTRVLVTGSAGRVGRAAVSALLAAGFQVTGFDRVPSPALAGRCVVGSLTDGKLLQEAVMGQSCVIHLAATPDDAAYPSFGNDNFLGELLPNNVVGVYHLLEAARLASTPKLVLASTGQVVWHQVEQGPWPVDAKTPYRPRYWYAATKVFLEAAAQAYSVAHSLKILVVRLGWCPRDAGQVAEIAASERHQDAYLSPGDAGRFFVRAVLAEDLPAYTVVQATSRPPHQCRYDLSLAKELLGFVPEDSWPKDALP